MQICPIRQNSYTNFTGLKYKNGDKTKEALNPEMRSFLSDNKDRIDAMKNVDIIVADDKNLMLGIKNIRYLDENYERFYDNGNYGINKFDDGKIDIWSGSDPQIHYRRRLYPTDTQGIYDVSYATVVGFRQLGNENYYESHSPESVLKCAEIIDSAAEKIDEAELKYGMDCVKVLEERDSENEEDYRNRLIDKLNFTYTFEDYRIPEKMQTDYLEKLYAAKDTVDELNAYGIHIAEDVFATPEITDKKGYIDEKYADAYLQNGYKIERDKECDKYAISPVNNEYVKYFLYPDESGKNYRCNVIFYEGGSNLSSFSGSQFNDLIRFVRVLDRISKTIEEG